MIYNWGDKICNKKKIFFIDETLREGEQTPGCSLDSDIKIRLADTIFDSGVDYANVGFPIVNEKEANSVQQIASTHNKAGGTARLLKKDIDAVIKTNANIIFLIAPISPLHIDLKFKGKFDIYAQMKKMIQYCDDHGLTTFVALEDGTRAPPENLIKILNIVKKSVQGVIVADTVGCLNSYATTKLCEFLTNKFPEIQFAAHFHNDCGLAVANTLQAIENGFCGISTTFNGFGERAGNAPLEELAINLTMQGFKHNIKNKHLYSICKLVESCLNIGLAAHKPVCGKFSFTHESGIHIDSLKKDARSYEHLQPHMVGRSRRYFYGQRSGKYQKKTTHSQLIAVLNKQMRVDTPVNNVREQWSNVICLN